MRVNEDYYQILELSADATLEDIKAAFRRLARSYHPDLHPNNPEFSEKFKSIARAYEILRNSYSGNSNASTQDNTSSEHYQDFYVRGIQLSLERDYQKAIENFSFAIAQKNDFLPAYLKRCETLYKLGDDRDVLKDCEELLKIDANCLEAYYYRGRSRYRLGYASSAIEAYNNAIKIANNYADAYYHRSLAYLEIEKSDLAIADLKIAAHLFQAQQDYSGYQLARDTLKKLQRSSNILFSFSSLFNNILLSFTKFLFNPVGELAPFFAKLNEKAAIYNGIYYAIVADLCFLLGIYLNRDSALDFSFLKLAIVGLIPFITLVSINAILVLILARANSWSKVIFVAGAAVLPLGFLGLVYSLSLPTSIMLIFTVFACCYTILILYTSLTQILNCSEATAAFILPIILLINGWVCYQFFIAIAAG